MPNDSSDVLARVDPDWPTCAREGCIGRQIERFELCLAHLAADDLDEVLEQLTPGVDLDIRGTTVTTDLLDRLLTRFTKATADHAPPSPHFGNADFSYCHFSTGNVPDAQHAGGAAPDRNKPSRTSARVGGTVGFQRAQFSGTAWFRAAQFDGDAEFDDARFSGDAVFRDARFSGDAVFRDAQFNEGAWFGGAQFSGTAWCDEVWFGRDAWFSEAQFRGNAGFSDAQFNGDAGFSDAQFSEEAGFSDAQFSKEAEFGDAQFNGDAWFDDAQFSGNAAFRRAQFGGETVFRGAQFSGNAAFRGAQFEVAARFGPLVVAGLFVVNGASFVRRVVVEVEAEQVATVDTRFEGGVELRVRRASITLRRAFFGASSSLSGAPTPFLSSGMSTPAETDPEHSDTRTAKAGTDYSMDAAVRPAGDLEAWVPRVLSVQETDVSQLTLADVDLRWCRFAGAHQLDKLRLEGRGPFNRPPRGWHAGSAWPPVWRWGSRRVLAEEHSWRARRRKSGGWATHLPNLRGVADAPPIGSERLAVDPERLAVLYRALRKAMEDNKNEAGAGDFYYGEMEARRHTVTTPRRERIVLTTYWMLSGYGQRAGRAFAVLAVLIGVLFGLLTQFGLPDSTAVQQMTGTIPAAVAGGPQQVILEVKPAAAVLPPQAKRWTAERMDKAIRIALGSVVFRDTDQKLTASGSWTVMAGRALGPLLIALAVLAIRARVKR